MRGHQWRNGGAYAEYVAVSEEVLARKPAGVTFEQAATVPTAGLIALANLRGQPGRVLVNGAGGGVGMLAVQLAKAARGARHRRRRRGEARPRAVARRRPSARRTREDFTRAGERYDLIFDVPGNHPFPACRRALTPDGKYVLIGHDDFGRGHRWLGSLPRFIGLLARTPFSRHLASLDFSTPSKRERSTRSRADRGGRDSRPSIDRTFTLEEVPAAIRYLASGRARGRVVIAVV